MTRPLQKGHNYFLTGPWPCLNTVCKSHHLRIIKSYELSYSKDSRRPVGRFMCPDCHMTYERVGPDHSINDHFKLSRFITFGPIWEEKLAQLWTDGSQSLRGIARQLGVDTRTVKRHTQRLNLPFPRPNNRFGKEPKPLTGRYRNSKQKVDFDLQRQRYRQSWLKTIGQYPDEGSTTLRKRNQAAFSWLWRHDQVWLKANRSALRQKANQTNNRVKWAERDISFAIICLRCFAQLLHTKNRPIAVTQTAIIRKAQIQAVVEQHRERLPLTNQVLKSICESRIEYALRRLWWVTRLPTTAAIRWRLVRLAGLGRLESLPIIDEAIDVAMKWIHTRQHNESINTKLSELKVIYQINLC